jgi:uncharacterized membrane protein
MNGLKQLWTNLRSSLWFVPVLIVVGCVGLALALIEVDGRINRELLSEYPRIFGDYRTIEQDAAFGIRQIVDVVLKALAVLATIESTASVEYGFVPCEVQRATYSGG